jgi:hydrogenase nickel incorporation protein HypA/HybF
MHELGLCASIVEAIERRAGERPVAKVRIRVGRMHHVHPEAFEQSFAIASAGGVADGAHAELVLLPVRGRCQRCGTEFEADEPIMACAGCGAFDLDITGGDELMLESIEYRPTDETSGSAPALQGPQS